MNKRILIIGCPGAGKSTFAQKLAQQAELPLIHLDKLYHETNRWSDDPKQKKGEWRRFVISLCDQDEWIMDGNYTSTLDIRIPRANLVIFLDFPRRIALFRALKRLIIYRNKLRPDMPQGWKEQYNNDFFKKIWNFNTTHRPQIIHILNQNKAIDTVVAKSSTQLETFLSNRT